MARLSALLVGDAARFAPPEKASTDLIVTARHQMEAQAAECGSARRGCRPRRGGRARW
jgi:hypothetical protein